MKVIALDRVSTYAWWPLVVSTATNLVRSIINTVASIDTVQSHVPEKTSLTYRGTVVFVCMAFCVYGFSLNETPVLPT